MKRVAALLLLLIVMPLALGEVQEQSSDITVYENGSMLQEITLELYYTEPEANLTYVARDKPSIVYSKDPFIVENAPYAIITFEKRFLPGRYDYLFSLYHEDFVNQRDGTNIFSMEFTSLASNHDVTIRLPPGHVLADTPVATSPKPDTITSDGRSIELVYNVTDVTEMIVLYELRERDFNYWLLLIPAAGIIAFFVIAYMRRRRRKLALRATLTRAEKQLLDAILAGTSLQNELVQQLGWSHSKMSKVVRNLEEKDAIKKKAHWKTNRIIVRRKWR